MVCKMAVKKLTFVSGASERQYPDSGDIIGSFSSDGEYLEAVRALISCSSETENRM